MTKQDWFKKYDKISYGITAGLISAFLGFLLNYFFNEHLFNSMIKYWSTFKKVDYAIISDMMTLALLMPMAIFYFTFFRKDYQQFSRGLLLMILPLVIFIIAVTI